jgi:hypothetical protein
VPAGFDVGFWGKSKDEQNSNGDIVEEYTYWKSYTNYFGNDPSGHRYVKNDSAGDWFGTTAQSPGLGAKKTLADAQSASDGRDWSKMSHKNGPYWEWQGKTPRLSPRADLQHRAGDVYVIHTDQGRWAKLIFNTVEWRSQSGGYRTLQRLTVSYIVYDLVQQ